MARARILVADDHEEVRNRIVQLLKRQFDVLAAVGDGPEFLEAFNRLRPDVCVLDISMPKMSGIEVAYRIKKSHADAKIVFLTLHDDFDFQTAALETGAEGYVTKARMGGDLLRAVHEVLAGRRFCLLPDIRHSETEVGQARLHQEERSTGGLPQRDGPERD